MTNILIYTILSPLIGILLISLVPKKYEEGSRVIALATTLLTAAFVYFLWTDFRPDAGFNKLVELPWIPYLGIAFRVGIDGVSLLMIALTVILTPLAILASWDEIKSERKTFYSLVLLCEVGLIGTFCALDMFLFYLFWEIMLIPMYFLIGIYGSGNRVNVAIKFLIFTMLGSALMLVGMIYLYLAAGNSFNMLTLSSAAISYKTQIWLFLAFGLAFAIKVPMVPFHTWLPDAHTEAPTAGSVLLAGVFLKAGAYGFFRIAMPYFPMAVVYFRPYIFALAVAGIIYGALLSVMQKDLKRLIAYSSVSHLGVVMLGLISLNPEAVTGAVLQMFNHGISTGALFILFGGIYYRYHTRNISDLGGIAKTIPVYSWMFIFAGLSSLGLPGLNNFIGEMLVFFGSFKAKPIFALIAIFVVIIAAIYILWAIERVFFGAPKSEDGPRIKDASLREMATMVPLFILIVLLGVYPSFAISKVYGSVANFLELSRRYIVEEQKEELNIVLPEIYQRGIDLIIPKVDRDDDRYLGDDPKLPSEEAGVEANEIEDMIRDQNRVIRDETHTIIEPNEGPSPSEGQDPFPEGVPSPSPSKTEGFGF